MWKVNGRTITDDFIVRVESLNEAKKVVKRFAKLGYSFAASPEKFNCYYIARSVVFDDGSEPTKKLVNWGRSEVEESDEFNQMMSYDKFMEQTK